MHADDESVDFDFAAIEATESRKDRAHDALVLAGFTSRQIADVLRAIGPVLDEEAVEYQKSETASDERSRDHDVFEFTKHVVMSIEGAGRTAGLEAALFRLAFDFRQENKDSLRRIALRWGLSPAAISKCVARKRASLKLFQSSFSKPEEVCSRHSLTNRSRRSPRFQ